LERTSNGGLGDAGNQRHGVPVWCDFILPNDWKHEWGGFDACPRCYEAQQAITQPMQRKAFLRSVPQATS